MGNQKGIRRVSLQTIYNTYGVQGESGLHPKSRVDREQSDEDRNWEQSGWENSIRSIVYGEYDHDEDHCAEKLVEPGEAFTTENVS